MNRRPKLESLEGRVVLSVVDLTTIGSSGTINGAIYRQAMTSPGGSGSLHPFVQIRRDGTEYGYNTDARPYTDPVLRNGGTQTTATFNRALPLSTVPLVAIGGQVYLDFSLEINQKKQRPIAVTGRGPGLSGIVRKTPGLHVRRHIRRPRQSDL